MSRDQRSRPCVSVPSRNSVDGKEMPIRWNDPQQFVRLALTEETNRDLRCRVPNVDALERHGVARSLERVDVRPEAAFIEPVNRLRRDQRSLRIGFLRIRVCEEVGEDRDHIHRDEHEGSANRELVLAEAPPHELPLRCDRKALLGDLAGLARRRMLGDGDFFRAAHVRLASEHGRGAVRRALTAAPAGFSDRST